MSLNALQNGESYAYSPLMEREFRLIRLQPGQWNDTIEFDLIASSLDPPNLPFYEAVSYVWGDPHGEKINVKCSGISMYLFPSAARALQRLRFSDNLRYLPTRF